jgi:Protein of unknown function (DUF4232)
MHFSMSPRRLAGVAALACAAALIPVTAQAATEAPAAATASTPACATSGLVVWLNTFGSGYAGGEDYTLNFTNLSGHTCMLHGYPGVSAVSLSGSQIGRPASWGTAIPATVSLADGATATAGLQIVNPGNFSTACSLPGPRGQAGKLPTAAGLRVYPPNQFTSKVIPLPFSACYGTGPVWMYAKPVQSL